MLPVCRIFGQHTGCRISAKRSEETSLLYLVHDIFRMRVGGAAPRQSRLLQCSVLEGGREDWEDRLEEAIGLVARCLQGDKSQNEVSPALLVHA